jgi:hypothetical protein
MFSLTKIQLQETLASMVPLAVLFMLQGRREKDLASETQTPLL